jgi:hypothetical protein
MPAEETKLAQLDFIHQGPASEPWPPSERENKKAYHRPRIVSREPLEAMAATCTGAKAKAGGVCTKLQS